MQDGIESMNITQQYLVLLWLSGMTHAALAKPLTIPSTTIDDAMCLWAHQTDIGAAHEPEVGGIITCAVSGERDPFVALNKMLARTGVEPVVNFHNHDPNDPVVTLISTSKVPAMVCPQPLVEPGSIDAVPRPAICPPPRVEPRRIDRVEPTPGIPTRPAVARPHKRASMANKPLTDRPTEPPPPHPGNTRDPKCACGSHVLDTCMLDVGTPRAAWAPGCERAPTAGAP